jgi:hemolysin activation/secretion protein
LVTLNDTILKQGIGLELAYFWRARQSTLRLSDRCTKIVPILGLPALALWGLFHLNLANAQSLQTPGQEVQATSNITAVQYVGGMPSAVKALLLEAQASALPAPTGAQLASRLTARLREAGYSIAQVLFLPADQQPTQAQTAFVRVYLGQIGKVTVDNASPVDRQTLESQALQALCQDTPIASPANPQAGSQESLPEGCVLQSKNLERAVALLKLNPGVSGAQASFSAQEVGVGQTHIRFAVTGSDNPMVGFVSVDNYGAPSTGTTRYGGVIGANSLFRSGDVFYLNAFTTNQGAFTGLVNWTQPLGNDGLRLDLQASQSQVIAPLGSTELHGVSKSVSAGLTHPITLLMSQQQTVQFNLGYVRNNNNLLGVGVLQDRQIPFASAGISGNTGPASGNNFASWLAKLTLGRPSDVAQGASASDASGPQVLNNFGRLYAQVMKRQQLGDSFLNAGINTRGQVVNRNVDPSMMLGFGGVDGARAYPVNEGAFSSGALASADLRATLVEQDKTRVYASLFTDYVVGQTYKNTWSGWNAANPSLQNTRHLYSYGVGLAARYGSFSGQVSYARKFSGSAQSIISPSAANGRVWLSASWEWR